MTNSIEDRLGITVDRARLRKAMELLLSPGRGAARSEKVKEAIKRLPSAPRLYRALEPLNEIIVVARQDALVALTLVEEADKIRESEKRKVVEAIVNETANSAQRRQVLLAENAKKYKDRLRNVIIDREYEIGRRLSPSERESYLAKKRKEWREGLNARLAQSVGVNRQDVQREYANHLNEVYRKRVERRLADNKKKN